MQSSKLSLFVILAAFALLLFLVACSAPASSPAATPTVAPAPAEETAKPPTVDGSQLLQERCTQCHDLGRVQSAKKSRDQWEQTVSRMKSKGARLTADEQKILVDHLAATYGP